MKLIKPSFEILQQSSGLDGVYKQIEIAGRTCYKSEDKITEDSAKEFVNRLIKSGHGAMLEHGTIYLYLPVDENKISKVHNRYATNKYSKVNKFSFVTTNYRVIIENNWLDDLQYLCEPTEYHEKRVTVKFICDRGVSHEFVRHRVFSFAQESTRYCNYSKNKFNNELTFIIPNWDVNISNGTIFGTAYETSINNTFEWVLIQIEKSYFNLLAEGWSPQQARSILPNSLKTELVMTGFIDDWKGFFELRTSTAAHPQARELAIPLQEWFQQNNLL